MSLRWFAFYLCVTATFCSAAAAQEKVELRLRLKKGDVYRLRLTVDQHVVQTPAPPAAAGPGQKQPAAQAPQSIDQSLGVGYSMTVDEVDAAGAMTVGTKYE